MTDLDTGIARRARLRTSYDQLIGDGWRLERRNILIGNSHADGAQKVLYIDDDDEPTETLIDWVEGAVRDAFTSNDDYRRSSILAYAMAAFRSADTALKRATSITDWAAWFWLSGIDLMGDSDGLMDDLTLVLAGIEPGGLGDADERYYLFRHDRFGYATDTTGFKAEFRDNSPQVRHMVASLHASRRFGAVGLALAQLRELIGTPSRADVRLNVACFEIASELNVGTISTGGLGQALLTRLGDPSENGPWTGPDEGSPDP